jgi:hypothetical protein
VFLPFGALVSGRGQKGWVQHSGKLKNEKQG